MSDNTRVGQRSDATDRPASKEWNWHPGLPIPNSPLFERPSKPRAILEWLAKSWLRPSMTLFILGTAVVTASFLQPALQRCVRFEAGWITEIYLRNLAILLIVAGALHLYFYIYKLQGNTHRFLLQEFAKNRKMFTFKDQVWDNMFWTIVSGVSIWSAYEVIYFWALANHYIPRLHWSEYFGLSVLVLLLTPFWLSFHFYFIHRLLHWPPLYRLAHSLHHRNVAVGPWSGLSMHPIEHLLYFSSILIYVVVPSNPVLMLFHMQLQVLNPLASHSGFADLLVRDKRRLALGEFHHQLHHRYFECNYGTADIPLDKWFGSFHDGTQECTERMRTRMRRGDTGKWRWSLRVGRRGEEAERGRKERQRSRAPSSGLPRR